MASPSADDLAERLKAKVDPKAQAQHDEDFNRRSLAQYEKGQTRLAELLSSNATLPVTISSVTVLNAPNTRRSFLDRIVHPLLSENNREHYTLAEAIGAVGDKVKQLDRFDIFHSPISTFFDRSDAADPNTTPTDLDIFLSVREKSRLVASSGTWAGSNDGSVYLNLLLRNLFGGGESFNANVSYGTRTRSAYSAGFDTPIFSNPDLRWEIGGLQSSTSKTWASHEERLQGGFSKLKWLAAPGHSHELSYSGMWRQVTGLAEKASPTVRTDAGDSFKSSVTHTWTRDRRDYPLLPTRGTLVKTVTELAGIGPLQGDVAFGKFEAESQTSTPIPVPFVKGDSGISFTTSFRGGLIYPLALGSSSNKPLQSRINDRFTLGGPTDVRGFRFAGLGPRDGADAVGGDLYAAGGASLLVPFPRVGKDQPLRLQAFINGGRLLALKDTRTGTTPNADMTSADVASSVRQTLLGLGDGLPSIAAGFGLVYALPVARLELNFSLPLVQRRGEEARKGLSVGIGLTFL